MGKQLELYLLAFIAIGLCSLLAAAGGYGLYRAFTDPTVHWASSPALGGYIFMGLLVLVTPMLIKAFLRERYKNPSENSDIGHDRQG